jgi:SAM-dependent methyltransferase
MQRVADWMGALPGASRGLAIADLGCGTGGLRWKSDRHAKLYIGVDSSFSSIARARSVQDLKEIEIPGDLLHGTTSRKVRIKLPTTRASADFVVGDLRTPPLASEAWDCAVSMNTIDMLERPEELPRAQSRLLKDGGHAIQSSPYVWHPQVAKSLMKKWGASSSSAQAVERLYASCGLVPARSEPRIPWLFFKHDRQIEIYWTHLFSATKGSLGS